MSLVLLSRSDKMGYLGRTVASGLLFLSSLLYGCKADDINSVEVQNERPPVVSYEERDGFGIGFTDKDGTKTVNSVTLIPADTKCTTPSVTPNYTVNNGTNATELERINKNLELVPDPVQRFVNSYGVKVNVVASIDDVQTARTQIIKQYPSLIERDAGEELAGFYSRQAKTVVVSQDHDTALLDQTSTELHEYGHALEDALTSNGVLKLNGFYDFIRIYRDSRANFNPRENRLGNYSDGLRSVWEFFAETFAMYYQNKRTRMALETLFPPAYEYWQKFDAEWTRTC